MAFAIWSGDYDGGSLKPELYVVYSVLRQPRHGFVNFQEPGVF